MTMDMLFSLISNLKGCQFATLHYTASVKLPKKSGLQNVTKNVETSCYLNASYTNGVNNRIENIGGTPNFKPQPLVWGVWEIVNKVISHKGARYLRFYSMKGHDAKVTYFVNGVLATDAEIAIIKQYDCKAQSIGTQSAVGIADAEQMHPKAVAFANITYIKVNKQEWTPTNGLHQVA